MCPGPSNDNNNNSGNKVRKGVSGWLCILDTLFTNWDANQPKYTLSVYYKIPWFYLDNL